MYTTRCTKNCRKQPPNAPSGVRRSENNSQAAEEKSYPEEIELENEGSNED